MLTPAEPHPVSVERADGASPIFLTCDHASNRIPMGLGDLGLGTRDLVRHIAWDIGAAGVARTLSAMLDAPLVMQNYSRLVVDCNRPRDSHQLVPTISEDTTIPGNVGLTEAEVAERYDTIHRPYHEAIAALLDGRAERGHATVFVAIHSFTPVYQGKARPWEIGVLYGSDRSFADHTFEGLAANPALAVGDNEPYRIDDKDYGIPVHGEDRRIPHVLFEIRQDLIANPDQQSQWGGELAAVLKRALESASA